MPAPTLPPKRRRTVRLVLICLVVGTAAAVAGAGLLDQVVRKRLEAAVQQAAGGTYQVHLGQVRTHLLQGSVEVFDVAMTFDSLAMDSLLAGSRGGLLRMRAERVAMEGLSYIRLLRKGMVAVQAIDIQGPVLHHFPPPNGQTADTTELPSQSAPPPLITVDTLRIVEARGGTFDVTGRRTSARLGGLDIHGGGITVFPLRDGSVSVQVRALALVARDTEVEFPPLYDLRIGTLAMAHPAGTIQASGVRFTPRADPQNYGRVVRHETDLFDAALDTLTMHGVDIRRFVVLQELFVRHAELRSPVLRIHRDKTMPDGPFVLRRLPPAGLRAMERTLRLDTITIHRGQVDYHERDSLNTDYGRVNFTQLEAVLTGMGNTPDLLKDGELRLDASAQLYDHSTLRARYRAPLREGTTAFTLDAHLRTLPFTVFNRMTDSLLMVEVRSGRIDELELHMQGNDDQARGTLDLVYRDLDVHLHSRDARQPRTWVLNQALHVLVRRDNLREAKNYRQGTFTVVRRKDRSIFNYAWRGVRAGTLDSMVPGMLSKHVQKRTNTKAREP